MKKLALLLGGLLVWRSWKSKKPKQKTERKPLPVARTLFEKAFVFVVQSAIVVGLVWGFVWVAGL